MRPIIIAMLALGCTQRADDILVDADQGDGGVFEKGRLDVGVDKTPLDAGGSEAPREAAVEMPGDTLPPIDTGSEPVAGACVGKDDNDVCGAESCAGDRATHHRCKAGVCVPSIEDCRPLYCVNGETFVVGTCGCVGEKCRCFAPVSMGMDCPAGQACVAVTPVVPDGAKASCVAVADGGAAG